MQLEIVLIDLLLQDSRIPLLSSSPLSYLPPLSERSLHSALPFSLPSFSFPPILSILPLPSFPPVPSILPLPSFSAAPCVLLLSYTDLPLDLPLDYALMMTTKLIFSPKNSHETKELHVKCCKWNIT